MVDVSAHKISIFVDVQNIYYTCRQACQASFDYTKFWAEVTNEREVVCAFAYATNRGDERQEQFQSILRAIGFTVKLKPMLNRHDGTAKADWDVGITLDVFEAASQCDTVVLASGDGDFDMLLQRIKQRFNTDTEVYDVPQLTSKLLIKAAGKFRAIDETLLMNKQFK